MLPVDTSLGVAGLVVGIPGLIQVCLELGSSVLKLIDDYRHSDVISEEIVLKIKIRWRNLEELLKAVNATGSSFLFPLETEFRRVLSKLSETLMQIREKASKLGMLSPQAQGATNIKISSTSVVWSKRELEKLLAHYDHWESEITHRLIVLTFSKPPSSSILAEKMNFLLKRLPRIRWDADVHEMSLNHEDFEVNDVSNSTVRYLRGKLEGISNHIVEVLTYHYEFKEPVDSETFQAFKEGVYNTARMLKPADPRLMSILPCIGIGPKRQELQVHYHQGNLPPRRIRKVQYELLYLIPRHLTKPRSLRDLLTDPAGRRNSDVLHPLDHRIRLANRLATALIYVHWGQFVHKHIKPENILIFDACDTKSFPLAIGDPFLVGFDRSRLEREKTTYKGDIVIEDAIYQHPERWGETAEQKSTMLHDIYSLGVVLLEIGLWRPFVCWSGTSLCRVVVSTELQDLFEGTKLKEGLSPKVVKDRFIKIAEDYLPAKMGQKYTDIVLTCINGNVIDSFIPEDDLERRFGLGYIVNVISKLEQLSV